MTAAQPKRVCIIRNDLNMTRMFRDRGWELTNHIEDANLVQFTGGEDVTPWLYGEPKHRTTFCNINRDIDELRIFGACLERMIPMAGICRGGQFLNVMCGGKMWQDVDGHAIGRTHSVKDLATGAVFQATSTHHQMMRAGPGSTLVAVADPERSNMRQNYWGQQISKEPEVEVVYYGQHDALCFQPHPEFSGYPELQAKYFEYIEKYLGVSENTDSLATHAQSVSQNVQNRISDPDHGYPDSESRYLTRAEYAEDQF